MDKLTKNRLTGAVIWLGALIWWVPQWYANPVEYPSLAHAGTKATVDSLDDIDFDQLVTPSSMTATPTKPSESAQVAEVTETSTRTRSNKPTTSTPNLADPRITDITEPGFYVRLISYQNPDNAVRLEQRLQTSYPTSIGSFTTSSGRFYTVRVGPYQSRSQAERVKAILDVELRVESIILDRTNQ
ncbi:SPOR domain-containing protein [Thiomicrospira sp. ALE5]|uniref:SPOR domain-containing protein n=1 Tax=Thiomicrospira sp. ALE5 TaxID=748650 RepID=UPI0008EB9D4D|nr:SPOR domain-containing protein [Thiomicrospira sp. ALE5]SFR48803.1 Sporulation related domain-containing protein [Thiomicrospira sp. ALE5]